MARFDASDLNVLAQKALDELYDAAGPSPGRSWAARLVLACLALNNPDRAPLIEFWTALVEEDGDDRRSKLSRAVEMVRRAHGLEPR